MPSVKVARPAPAKNNRSQSAVKLPGSLSLVLPAHNEEENIRVVVEQALEVLPKFTSQFEIIVVNDGSRDHTAEIIDDLAANDSRVRAIHHKRNKGYGGALTTGFQATTCDFVMFMDSDRQFDINDIALLAPFVGKYDIVAGVRLERNDPFHRRLFAQVFNLTVRVLFGVHLHDIDCAFKIFRGDLLRSMQLTAPGALINTEIQAKARRQGATVEQVGVHHYPRVAGEASGGSPKVIFRAMRETILLWWRMHSYVPPTTSNRSKGPYLVGDLLLGAATFLGIPAIISFGRRLFRRN
jgi:glycosyltransferase involved in cell wall biosynthesis